MNEEIKEILDYLKNNTFIPDETKRKYKILHRDEVNRLLNYITSLQEENQKLVKVIEEIKFVFDNPENYFSDGCDCREIEDIINKLTELKGGSDE